MKKSRKAQDLGSSGNDIPDEAVANVNDHHKVVQVLGDKKLMPRAARKRLGSSLSGAALHHYIEEKKKEDDERIKAAQQA